MRIPLLTPALLAGLSSMAVGQMTAVIPSAYAAAEASSSTSYPWNRNSANGHRIQYCYDSSLFSQASPILISRLRWRANGTTSTWTGVTHPNVKIDLSSATVDQAALSTTFASNHGNDRANVFSGNVVVAPSPAGGGTTPNIFYVDVQFTAPFLYDPSAGNDLLIDITLPGGWTNGTTSTSLDCEYNTTSPNASRMYSLSDANSPTGSFQAGVAPVIEMTYNPATGIYANFDATPVEGKSPLQVQFTDKTFTSDPNGVTKWEWDFNNDQVIDSTAQNPQFTFTGVGYDVKYTVSLKVTDGTNGSNTLIKKDYIVVNPFPVASATPFGAGSTVPTGVPGPIQMTPYSRTYSSSSQTRGWWAQAPVTFVINGFDVPNEQSATHQSVWFFTTPANSQPSSYTPTAADTKFLGTGLVGTTLTPSAPIVVQQGTWFGVLGACHDAAGTTMHNSYDAGTTANQNTTVMNTPMQIRRLTANVNLVTSATPGSISMGFATSSNIARVDVHVPGNLQSTIPMLAASGDTPYFGANPQLDMTASIPGAQAGLLAASLQSLPVSIPTPFGGLLISPSFFLTVVVPNGTGSVNLPIPNDPGFADAHIYWQGIVFDLTNNVFGMTNGIDWLIGQQ